MAWNVIFFYILAAISLLAAIGMVAAKNPVHSAIFLVLTLFNTAGVFVMLGADFLAAVQVIVYAGAVLVLMLLFLMLVDPQRLPERGAGHPVQRIMGPLLGIILFLEVAAAIANRAMIGSPGNATPPERGHRRRQHAGDRQSPVHPISAAVRGYLAGATDRRHRRHRARFAGAVGRAAQHDLAGAPAWRRCGATRGTRGRGSRSPALTGKRPKRWRQRGRSS